MHLKESLFLSTKGWRQFRWWIQVHWELSNRVIFSHNRCWGIIVSPSPGSHIIHSQDYFLSNIFNPYYLENKSCYDTCIGILFTLPLMLAELRTLQLQETSDICLYSTSYWNICCCFDRKGQLKDLLLVFAAVHNKWEMNEALGLGMWVINSALLAYWEKG